MPGQMSYRLFVALLLLALMFSMPLLIVRHASDRMLSSFMGRLVYRFPAAKIQSTDRIAGIIALGGSTERTREAIRLAHLYPHARLVVTGAALEDYQLVSSQDFERNRFVPEYRASNTFENALFTRQLIKLEPGERWLLVTSATHMPRAIASFESVGFPVEAWPIYDVSASDPGAVDVIRHEWLGLIAYHLLGRTTSFLPSRRA